MTWDIVAPRVKNVLIYVIAGQDLVLIVFKFYIPVGAVTKWLVL